ncbi:ribokinase [Tessaracoccus sp. ZS01]|nr:ribokinase [Tessaracoccus sp. ZS01]OMG54107.1 ribokinase [Tessaracoccus sp. ZS01]
MRDAQIVVIGSANVDHVVEIDHRPAGGETILGSDLVFTPGGKGANQAVAAGRLGGAVAFVGALGADGAGELLRGSLLDAGVDLRGLGESEAPTGLAIIMLTPDGENSIIVAPGANRHVTPERVAEVGGMIAGARVVVAQLEIPMETVVAAAQLTREGRFVLNAAPPRDLPPELLKVCDPLVVNESEAAYLLERNGNQRGEELAVALLGLGVRSVVVTMGAEGAYVAGGDALPVHVPAVRVTAIDTTGAGDSFVGALAVRLAEDASLVEAAGFATRVAAVSVGRRGAQESYPTLSEVLTDRDGMQPDRTRGR